MEELRSTEVLDREILEDARKKAFKILKTADDTLLAQKREWEKKTEAALDSIRKVYAERTKKSGEEIIARLPLDSRRLRSKIAEDFLSGAAGDFLRHLKRETLLALLERELLSRLEVIASDGGTLRGARVFFTGMSLSETKDLLKKVSGRGKNKDSWNFEGFPLEELSSRELAGAAIAGSLSGGAFPSLLIDTQAFRITASVENAAALLMKDKRAELAAALLGEEVLND